MLGASSEATGGNIDLAPVEGSDRGDGNIEHGALLSAFVEAAVGADPDALNGARAALSAVGGEAFMLDAAAVMANFEMMTRVADATGARFQPERNEAMAPIRQRLGLDELVTAR